MYPFQNGSFRSGILNKSTESGYLARIKGGNIVPGWLWIVFFSLFAIMTLKYKKYRTALKRKENKKSKWKLLTLTNVILIYNIIAYNLHY